MKLAGINDIDWERTTLRQLKTLRKKIKIHPTKYGVNKGYLTLIDEHIRAKQEQHAKKVNNETTTKMIKFLQKVIPQ
jgi:hypothetical protein